MNYLELHAIRQQQAALSDADFLTWINATVVIRTERRVELRDVNYYLFASGLMPKLMSATA